MERPWAHPRKMEVPSETLPRITETPISLQDPGYILDPGYLLFHTHMNLLTQFLGFMTMHPDCDSIVNGSVPFPRYQSAVPFQPSQTSKSLSMGIKSHLLRALRTQGRLEAHPAFCIIKDTLGEESRGQP